MLIGIDASRAAKAQRTGTENYSLYLIRALIERGQQHRFRLYFNQPPAAELFAQDERVQWRVIPFPRLWTHVRLAREVQRDPPDVLFVPSHVLPWLPPRRCVATVHDLGYRHYPQAHTFWSRLYLEWSTRHNARVARRVIADSQATRNDLVAFYGIPLEKIVVAYPSGGEGFAPVRDATILADVQRRYQTGTEYLLYLGTLQPRKNLDTLLRAFASLIQASAISPQIRLVLAGQRGWLCEELDKLVGELNVTERVVMPGYVHNDDLAALLSGARAFVLPSWYEGFGLPVLEAMACDTPVICSNVASLPEVAGDAALLIDPYDMADLADAIRRVCEEPALRAELVRRGRERVQAFSWSKCAAQVLAAIEQVGAEG